MEAIFPTSALAKEQVKVKQAARKGVVRITEHGSAAFVFCSEEVFENKINEAVEEALYLESIRGVITQGREDYQAGRFIEGTDAARAETERRRLAHD